MEHARNEYCEESVLLWDCIQKYRTTTSYNTRLQLAHHIYNTFLSPEAQADVNIKEGTRTSIWTVIETGQFDDDMFDALEMEVEECLADIYCRFSVTDEYTDYMDQVKKNKHIRTRSSSMPNVLKPLDTEVSEQTNKRFSLMLSPGDLLRKLSPRSPKQK
jgi:hypothetical protein